MVKRRIGFVRFNLKCLRYSSYALAYLSFRVNLFED